MVGVPKALRGHWGVHAKILEGVLSQKKFPVIFRSIVKAVEGTWSGLEDSDHVQAVVVFMCRSGRHRSVGMAYCLEAFAESMGASVRVVHCESGAWHRSLCTTCAACAITDAKRDRIVQEILATNN